MKCAIFSFLFLQTCQSANVVAFMPLPFHSHLTAFKPLWLALARRGHRITLIQPTAVIKDNDNITNIILSGVHDIVAKGKPLEKLGEGQSPVEVMSSALEVVEQGIEYELSHPEVQELLKRGEKVDLFFSEFLLTFGFALGYKLKAPMIGLVSMDASIEGHTVFGNPTHPIMYPDRDMTFSRPGTFVERLSNVYFWLGFQTVFNFVLNPLQERVTERCLGLGISAYDIKKNISLLFINANPLFNEVRPLGSTTVNVGGGIHLVERRQPLSTDLQDYLDNSKNGVVYFSLGSLVTSKLLLNSTKDTILDTFSQLPYDILWKFDEEIAKKPDNVKIMKWVPQQDLLRHENVKLFITQGGLLSMEEAVFSYVPMIALPFFGDQHNNANKMAAKGFGLKLDYKTLDVKTFKNAILEIFNNSVYRERTKELADLVMDQPMSGLEKAVWWTEYVLRHGHTNMLKNPVVDIPWYQFLLLDVISFFILTAVVTVHVSIKTLQFLKWLACKQFNLLTKRKKD